MLSTSGVKSALGTAAPKKGTRCSQRDFGHRIPLRSSASSSAIGVAEGSAKRLTGLRQRGERVAEQNLCTCHVGLCRSAEGHALNYKLNNSVLFAAPYALRGASFCCELGGQRETELGG